MLFGVSLALTPSSDSESGIIDKKQIITWPFVTRIKAVFGHSIFLPQPHLRLFLGLPMVDDVLAESLTKNLNKFRGPHLLRSMKQTLTKNLNKFRLPHLLRSTLASVVTSVCLILLFRIFR